MDARSGRADVHGGDDLARLVRLVDAGDLRLPVASVLDAADCVRPQEQAQSAAVGTVVVATGARRG